MGSMSKNKLPGEEATTIAIAGGSAGMAAAGDDGGDLNGMTLPLGGAAGVSYEYLHSFVLDQFCISHKKDFFQCKAKLDKCIMFRRYPVGI